MNQAIRECAQVATLAAAVLLHTQAASAASFQTIEMTSFDGKTSAMDSLLTTP